MVQLALITRIEMTKFRSSKIYIFLIGNKKDNLSFILNISIFTIALASAFFIGKTLHQYLN